MRKSHAFGVAVIVLSQETEFAQSTQMHKSDPKL
jgi:hypothetical protein